jgi:sulfide:quinone oxidoreductase
METKPMEPKMLDQKVSVSAQVDPAQIAEIANRGFVTLICNRPDGEAPGQPAFAELAAKAEAAGLRAIFMPVTAATMGPDAASEFAAAIEESAGPVLAYCRTGTRCTKLWTRSRLLAGDAPDTLRSQTQKAGYDMSAILDRATP